MKLRLIIGFILLIIFSVSFLPINVSAFDPIDLIMAPENPAPGDQVLFNLTSYAVNLASINITWYVNGKQASSGIGLKSFSVTAPQAGAESNIRIVISIPTGNIEKRAVIRPSNIVILWQAIDSYTPPFYKGKALPIPESRIKAIAIPEIKSGTTNMSPKNLLFYWNQNSENQLSDSGYGKSPFTFVNDYFNDIDSVGVIASTLDGSKSAASSINIRMQRPEISFYANDSLLGMMWENALKDEYKMPSAKTIIAAEPYFISPKQLWSPSLSWDWYLNGLPTYTDNSFRPNWLPIATEGSSSGSSEVGVSIENKNELFSSVSKQIRIDF